MADVRRVLDPQSAAAMMRALTVLLLFTQQAFAHDCWSDGKPVPAWVKASCCGPADAHHLRPDQVHRVSDDFYEVDGFPKKIPATFAIPSQDGDYWIFYGDQNGKPTFFCFFVPMDF